MEKDSANAVMILMLYVVCIIAVIFFSAFRGTLVSEQRAIRALEKRGYSDIKITDKSVLLVHWRGCGTTDAVKFDAVAKNPRGTLTDVYVCSGWLFKGTTVRTD